MNHNYLNFLEEIIKKCWCEDTCNPLMRKRWDSKTPYIGQCVPTALLINDFFDGKLIYNKKLKHVWNILPDNTEYDLTRKQFPPEILMKNNFIITKNFFLNNKRGEKISAEERYLLLKSEIQNFPEFLPQSLYNSYS